MIYTIKCFGTLGKHDPLYPQVYDFLLRCADQGVNEHFHWARFEWMLCGTLLQRDALGKIALFVDEQNVPHGLCTYDTSEGEGAYLIHDTDDAALLNRMADYAEAQYGRIIPNLRDEALLRVLHERKWENGWGGNKVLSRSLEDLPNTPLPEGFTLSVPHHVLDRVQYQTVIEKGFFEEEGDIIPWPDSVFDPPPPHWQDALKVFALRSGEYCAHAGVWYTSGDTAYIEPVVTLPACRRMGLASACLTEALRRARAMGAKRALVLSGDSFYRNLGFADSSRYEDWEPGRD